MAADARRRVASTRLKWVRILVDAAMSLCLLAQMLPTHTGGLYHEVAGIAFVVLLVVHHVLNWRRLRAELAHLDTARNRLAIIMDVLLVVLVLATMASGLAMARYVTLFSVGTGVSFARLAHSCFTCLTFMFVGIHVGTHVPFRRIRSPYVRAVVTVVACVAGIVSATRLGVAGKLTWQLSFPDGITPTPMLVLEFLCLGAMCVVAGAWLSELVGGRRGNANTRTSGEG